LSGDNTNTGTLTLVSASRIQTEAGTTLTQSGTVNNAGFALTVNTVGTTVISGAITNTGGFIKDGAGTLTLSGNNTYSGATTVDDGVLRVSGSISNSVVTVQDGALLGGDGVVGETIINAGGTIAPGNSPGTLTINGDLTWNNGGSYDWEVLRLNSEGIEGTDWDLLSVTGTLNLTNLTGAPFFNINLYSLSATNSPGALANWSNAGTYGWKILTAGTAIDANYLGFVGINTGNFAVYNDISGGIFALELRNSSKDLYLTYTGSGQPIPEPGTWAAAALLAAAAGFLRWRKRRVT
jgi:autotransporter-associated beta strand protein